MSRICWRLTFSKLRSSRTRWIVWRSRRRSVVDGVNHRKRRLAFAQIAGHGLAQHFFSRRQVEHVIDNLECQADGRGRMLRARLLAASVAPASTAPSRMETENRQAVLRKIRS